MGSLNPENEPKQELNDSGYVQEDASKGVPPAAMNKSSPNLLDLSDDVLLCILQYCSPLELKALGYTCARLGTLVLDRTLWVNVDTRNVPTGKNRMRWFLTHALNKHTASLKLSGYAREAKGCLGYMSGSREEEQPVPQSPPTPSTEEVYPWSARSREPTEAELSGPRLLRLCAQALPRYGGELPYWRERTLSNAPRDPSRERAGISCPGPQVTLSRDALCRLTTLCTQLTELALDHVVVDCNMTQMSMFPKSLRSLSLVGTKCFNQEKPFLAKIQDYLIHLENLDVSECEWVEPASMLPLSKMMRLSRLSMRLCPKLTEFVAYASLATRYGFRQLKVLDMRGSPVGDSEVSALGWVPLLEELYLSPAANPGRTTAHAHFSTDPILHHAERLAWEEQEPEYYKSKYEAESWIEDEKSRPNMNHHAEECAIGSCVVLHRVNGSDGDPLGLAPPGTIPARPGSVDIPHLTGYIIPKTGIRRTMNMYPQIDGADPEPTEEGKGDARQEGTEKEKEDSRKRKQEHEDDGPAKHSKCDKTQPSSSKEFLNEPSTSKSFGRDKINNLNAACSNHASVNEPKLVEPTSSNEPNSKSAINSDKITKEVPTKGSRKHFDSNDCQISRLTLKASLDDFKKRTGFVFDLKDDFFDSDDDSLLSDDDDDEDDDTPQPKRFRLNEGASTSTSDAKVTDSKKSSLKHKEPESLTNTEPNSSTLNAEPSSTSNTEPSSSSNTEPKSSTSNIKSCSSNIEPKSATPNTEPSSSNIEPKSSSNAEPSSSNTEPKSSSNAEPSSSNIEPNPSTSNIESPDSTSKESNGSASLKNQLPPANEPSTSQKTLGNQKPQRFVRFRLHPRTVTKETSGHSTRDDSNQQKPDANQDNRPAVVIGYNDDQVPIMIGCSNEPMAERGCGNNQPASAGEGCSNRDDNHNVHNNNDSEQPDWNSRVSMHRIDMQRISTEGPILAPTPSQVVNPANMEIQDVELARHRILYVNVGRRRHAMYQISMPEPIDLRTQRPLTAAMNLIYSSHIAPRLEYSALVTDAAIRRFGRADGENYVQIGPMGPVPAAQIDPNARPNRSNLRILSVTGFRHVSDYSLTHLATAAPHLEFVDFTGTRVTDSGVEHFRNFRTECRVRYGPVDSPKEVGGRPSSR